MVTQRYINFACALPRRLLNSWPTVVQSELWQPYLRRGAQQLRSRCEQPSVFCTSLPPFYGHSNLPQCSQTRIMTVSEEVPPRILYA